MQQAFLDCKLHVGGLARHTRWEQCLQQVVSDWELHMGGGLVSRGHQVATIVVASLFRLEAASVGDYQGTLGRNDWCGRLSKTWGL